MNHGPTSGELEMLIARKAQQGDRNAFNVLIERNAKSIYNLVARMLPKERDAAQDIVQDTFLSAFRGFAGFRLQCRVSTWFHRIAVNKVLNYRSKRKLAVVPLHPTPGEEHSRPLEIVDPSAGPQQNIEDAELQRLILEWIGELPESLRAVFTLRELQKRSYDEIAEILEISPEAVRVRLHRSKKELAKRLAPYMSSNQTTGMKR